MQTNVTQGNFNQGAKSDERCLQEAQEMMPELSNDAQKVIWLRVCSELLKVDRMKPLFIDALAQFCYVLARMNFITQFLEDSKNGYTYIVEGRNGEQIKNRPEMAERNELFRQWKSLVGDFGLSPTTEKTYVNGIGSQGDLPGMGGGDQMGWGNFPDSK